MNRRRGFSPPALVLLLIALLLVLLPDVEGRLLLHGLRHQEEAWREEEILRRALLVPDEVGSADGAKGSIRSNRNAGETGKGPTGATPLELRRFRISREILCARARLLVVDGAPRREGRIAWVWKMTVADETTHRQEGNDEISTPRRPLPRPPKNLRLHGPVFLESAAEESPSRPVFLEGLEGWDERRRLLGRLDGQALRSWFAERLSVAGPEALPRELPSACRTLLARIGSCSPP